MILLTRDDSLNHCPMKPSVIHQFDIFTFVISRTICYMLHVIFSINWWKPEIWIFGGETQKGENCQGRKRLG